MKRMTKKMEMIVIGLYFAVVLIGIVCVLRWMTLFTYDSMGEYAVNIAKMASASLHISDEELNELMDIEFDQLQDTKLNKELEYVFEKANLSTNIEYVYILRKLDESEIKYTVNSEELSEYYNEEIGTELDYIWILDYIVNDSTKRQADKNDIYANDIYRYTTVSDSVEEFYNDEEAHYILKGDKVGTAISGFAPIYTDEGTYIGLLGVDVYSIYFHEYKNKIIFTISLLVLFLVSILLYAYRFYYISIKHELDRDKLTGLYTRKYYEKYANRILKTMEATTVIMIDIDNFKLYNDYYGHIMGDDVLANVARLISEETEAYKGCVGRFGGEEFIVILPQISVNAGNQLCEKIRKRVEDAKIEHEESTHNKIVTVSVGVFTVNCESSALSLNEVIEKADIALYQAKNAGRNKYIRNI